MRKPPLAAAARPARDPLTLVRSLPARHHRRLALPVMHPRPPTCERPRSAPLPLPPRRRPLSGSRRLPPRFHSPLSRSSTRPLDRLLPIRHRRARRRRPGLHHLPNNPALSQPATVHFPTFSNVRRQTSSPWQTRGGGVLLLGVDDNGQPTGAHLTSALAVDPADVTNKIFKYAGLHFHGFQILPCEKEEARICALCVEATRVPIVFTKVGTYEPYPGKQKNVFSVGSVYFSARREKRASHVRRSSCFPGARSRGGASHLARWNRQSCRGAIRF